MTVPATPSMLTTNVYVSVPVPVVVYVVAVMATVAVVPPAFTV